MVREGGSLEVYVSSDLLDAAVVIHFLSHPEVNLDKSSHGKECSINKRGIFLNRLEEILGAQVEFF